MGGKDTQFDSKTSRKDYDRAVDASQAGASTPEDARRSAARAAVVGQTQSTPSLTEEWTVTTTGSPQYSTPAVGAEHVYVGGLDATLSARYPSNGSVAWSFERAGSLSDSSPTVANGTVYVGSGGGVLYAPNETDDSETWTDKADSAIVSSPTVDSGTVYVGANDRRVLAIDASDGTLDWEQSVSAPVYSRPAVGTHVFVTTSDGRIVALDTASGDEEWAVETNAALRKVGQLQVHTGYAGDYVVFAFPMAKQPTLKHTGSPASGELVEVDSKSAVQSEESIEDTRYYWDDDESTLWLRVVTNSESGSEFGTLLFK